MSLRPSRGSGPTTVAHRTWWVSGRGRGLSFGDPVCRGDGEGDTGDLHTVSFIDPVFLQLLKLVALKKQETFLVVY